MAIYETIDRKRAEAKENEAQQPSEEESGDLHSSSEESLVRTGEKDQPVLAENNSEADPVDGTEEEKKEEELGVIHPGPEENVQSSEERSESER